MSHAEVLLSNVSLLGGRTPFLDSNHVLTMLGRMYVNCYIYCPKVTQGTASSLILLMTIKHVYHPPPQLTPTDNIFTQPSNLGPDHPNDNQLPGFSATFGGFESHMTHLGLGQNQFTYRPPLPPSSKPTPAGWMQQIDPSLINYEHKDDKDEFPPLSTFLSDISKPAKMVAGSLHMSTTIPTAKGKGKARVVDSAQLKHNHQQGAPNYNEDDIDACESCLPVGAKSWNSVEAAFSQWAQENDHPAHLSKSLKLKFKQPMGDAECPPYIDRAHYIDSLINEKAGTHDLNDKELADEVVKISDDNEDTMASVVLPKTKPTQIKLEVHEPRLGPTACHATSPTISLHLLHLVLQPPLSW
ncbi:hypothetical protein C8R48DRAFT_779119 [Suillus tomentosus]|nr:hypothetical protein C8R48DRAFT_779119 [Suillus tomentosus]